MTVKSGGAAAENNLNSDNTVQVRTDAVIFVSAAGIAVRHIAPYAVSKTVDPAVIAVNDNCIT